MDRILVTGGNGFVGRHLVSRLNREGHPLTLAQRVPGTDGDTCRFVAIDNVGPQTDWRRALEGCDTVVHLAGQVPRRHGQITDFHSVNDAGTARLVEQALAAGAKRFVFLSSVSAAIESGADFEITEQSPGSPSLTPYGASKRAGEDHVSLFAQNGRVGISLRPPLVYAFDAKGSWRTLQRLAAWRLPLPFGGIRNRRSLIAVENLVDALLAAIDVSRTRDASGTYFVADGRSVDVREIFTWLRQGMGLPPLLVPIPARLLRAPLRWIGRDEAAQRLLGDLVIDSTLFRVMFNWTPRLDPGEAIRRSGAQYLAGRR